MAMNNLIPNKRREFLNNKATVGFSKSNFLPWSLIEHNNGTLFAVVL
jgi:hypothetical protein